MRAALVLLGLSSLASARFPPDFQGIRELIDSGRYARAELEAERTVSSLENAPDEVAADRLQAIDLLVEALVSNGKGAEARTQAFAQRVIRDREAEFGPNHPALGLSLRNLGKVLLEAGDYRSAISPLERAVALHEQAPGAGALELAEDLDLLVQGLTLIETYDRALTTNDRALDIKEKQLSPTDVRIARTLEVRGLLLQRRGDYPGARRALERALTLREAANPEHPRIAETLGLLKEQLQVEGDLVGAQHMGERALAVAEKTLRPDHPEIASYLRSLAIPVTNLGDLARGRALRERGLAIAEKALGPDHPLVGVQLNDLASSYFREGEYLRARTLFERALSVYERLLGPDHSRVMTEIYNLALVSDKLGDFQEARRQFDRVIKRWERVFGPNHSFVALVADALAESLSTQGRDVEARAWYERALQIRELVGGKNHPDVARTLTLLSASVARLGQTAKAHELSARALRIWEQSTGDTQRVAASFVVHGAVQADEGDYPGARASYDRALGILRRVVGPSHPDVAEVDVRLAATLARMDQRIEALRNALEAEKIGRDHLRLMLRNLPERQGLEYGAKRPKGLDFALSVFAPSPDEPDANQVFDEVVRSRGVLLDEMSERRHLAADAARPELAPLWTALVSARQRFANLVIRGSSGLRGDQYATLLDQARREKEEAERALAEKSGTFRNDLLRTEVGLDAIRAALPRDSALVAFVRYDRTLLGGAGVGARSKTTFPPSSTIRKPVPSYMAFVLRGDDTPLSVVTLGSATVIDGLVVRWREESTGILYATSARAGEQAYRTAGAALRRRVWDPIAKDLNNTATVFVVPDGTLNLVSLATLPIGPIKYLIDQGPVIHYLSAERDLTANVTASSTNRGLLAIGGAAFDDATLFTGAPSTSARKAANSQRPPAALARVRGSCGDLQTIRFDALAGTMKEVRQVARLWQEPPAQVLERHDASERAFKDAAPGHRVLHLATHGFFLGSTCTPTAAGTRSVGGLAKAPGGKSNGGATDNPLVLSGLALAGANRRAAAGPNDEDGILTAEEVAGLNLEGVEWAVLSACDTGLGEVRVGEGVFGLRRAFQVAGVRTVIMSLWSVEDQATLEWMRALYVDRLQKKLSTAEAVRDASLTVLRARRARGESTHPFYWGAFVAAGDWR